MAVAAVVGAIGLQRGLQREAPEAVGAEAAVDTSAPVTNPRGMRQTSEA